MVGALKELASCELTIVQNALAIPDLLLQRWLDVVVLMPFAFEDSTRIGFDATMRFGRMAYHLLFATAVWLMQFLLVFLQPQNLVETKSFVFRCFDVCSVK